MTHKTRITITVDPHLLAHAERQVELGKVPSVSAFFNDAAAARVERGREARRMLEQKAAEARSNPEIAARVDRMMAYVEKQRRELAEHEPRS